MRDKREREKEGERKKVSHEQISCLRSSTLDYRLRPVKTTLSMLLQKGRKDTRKERGRKQLNSHTNLEFCELSRENTCPLFDILWNTCLFHLETSY